MKKYKRKVIYSFNGDYRWLSNFYPAKIVTYNQKWEEVIYPSAEHAYQAAKSSDPEYKESILTMTAGQAKRAGAKVELRDYWEEKKENIMYIICKKKFSDNPTLKQRLIRTGDALLIEGNTRGDRYWGVCEGVGQNKLGEILMSIRKELGGM